MTVRIDYRVEGLDCAEEVALLNKAVGAKAGILNLDFDVIQGRMAVTYDPDRMTPEGIEAAVRAAGMRAVPWRQGATSFGDSTRRGAAAPGGGWERHGRMVLVAVSAALLAAGFVVQWILGGSFWEALTAGHATGHSLSLGAKALMTLSVAAGARYFVPKAIASARSLRPDMNLLMTMAVIGAMAIGDWFEGAAVSLLFALALMLEHWSVDRARRAIESLMDLAPPKARVLDTASGQFTETLAEQVRVAERVLVRPGERIPLDGLVAQGTSRVNQAPITGESMPVDKTVGDELYAGTINEDGALEFTVTRRWDDTTLARIIHLVREAPSRRAPREQWVQKFARAYTPAMIALAAAVAIAPPLWGAGPWMDWLYRGLVLLVIGCPCALVISTPVTVVSALTRAARNGVLVKGGLYLELAGRLEALAIDKTGTLTHGRPTVQQVVPLDGHTAREVLELAAALEVNSQHPLAKAICQEARRQGIVPGKAEGYQRIGGKGAEATIGGEPYWIGSHRFLHERGEETPEVHALAERLEDAGHSVVALGNSRHVCGLISLADAMREGAAEAIAQLRRLGVRKIVMLSGDNEGTARAVAAAAGVDEFHAEMLPEDKAAAVRAAARDRGVLAMIGDGVNDAPAMAAASFGLAMAAMGADAAIETADVALMSDDLSAVPWLVRHGRRMLAVIQQNIALSLGIKAAFIALSVAGAATLWMAIAADMGASLLVTFNGLRLLADRK